MAKRRFDGTGYAFATVTFLVSFALAAMAAPAAAADSLRSPDDLDTAITEAELERIAKESSPTGAKARAALAQEESEVRAERQGKGKRRARASKRIVNGLGTIRYPAAGALLKGADRKHASAWCSGTLVGCSTFLTAAHCVEDDPSPAGYKVFFQHAGFYDVAKIDWQKDKYNFPDADVAVIKLARPVEGIAPIAINRAAKPINGSKGRIVGFGRTGGENNDYGIKRMGFVRTSACVPPRSDTTLVCWKYDAAIKTPGEDSNTCNGDSGGSLQIEGDGTVAGVTSGGKRGDCLGGDRAYDANVFEYHAWIEATAGEALGTAACGTGTPLDVLTHVIGDTVALHPGKDELTYQLDIPPGLAKLRVAMNGEDNGTSNFDLYLLQGSSTDVATAACSENGAGQFGFCEISDPGAGKWTIVVRRVQGAGLVQTVVTMLPRMP